MNKSKCCNADFYYECSECKLLYPPDLAPALRDSSEVLEFVVRELKEKREDFETTKTDALEEQISLLVDIEDFIQGK